MLSQHAQERVADAGAAVSVGGTAWAWIGDATEVMQFVVLVIAAISGIASAYYHISKARRERKG
jgi:hypothetical protein